jgi:hypothetical protein
MMETMVVTTMDIRTKMVMVEVEVEVMMEFVTEAAAMVVTKVTILKHLLSLRFGNDPLHKYKPSSRTAPLAKHGRGITR